MKTDQYGQIIYNESDLVSMIMRDATIESLQGMLVEPGVTLETASAYLEQVPDLIEYAFTDMTVEEFDVMKQNSWHMPDEYKQLDIAEYVLSLCDSDARLQRCGEELLLFQERNLFDLLRYLKYLVDTSTCQPHDLGGGPRKQVWPVTCCISWVCIELTQCSMI
jgi:hypothetical protein